MLVAFNYLLFHIRGARWLEICLSQVLRTLPDRLIAVLEIMLGPCLATNETRKLLLHVLISLSKRS